MRFRSRWLAWLCLSLMFWAAMAESTHNHANQTGSASCTICMVAHSSAPAPTCHQSTPVFAAIGVLAEKEVSVKPQLRISELEIRGPPAA